MIEVKINTDTLTNNLIKKFKGLTTPNGVERDKLLRKVAVSIGGEMRKRIHVDGLKSDGTLIGKYNSTKPIYVNPKNSPRKFATKGKPKNIGKFKTGKKKGQDRFISKTGETRYFESYKDFRDYVGLDTSKVNLSLNNSGMENDFKAVGQDPIKTNTGYGLGFTNSINAEKAEGHEKKYGTIYSLTEQEKTMVRTIAEDFIKSLGFR